jgi:type I restriction enzyme S subunit
MSFPKYSRYKDSSVELVGQVPEHWKVVALKRIADIQTGMAKGKDNASRRTVTVPYMRVANVQDGYPISKMLQR